MRPPRRALRTDPPQSPRQHEDLWVALERTRDFVTAERLGLEFGKDFQLLQDIGWDEHDERETFELTMPPHDLMEVLRRLQGEAVEALVPLGDEAQSTREDADTNRRFQLGYETCEKVLPISTPRILVGQRDRLHQDQFD